MITRRNLAEQLRDYQIRSQRDWSSLSFWTATTRADNGISSRWNLFLIIVLFAAAGILYFRDLRLSLSLFVIGIFLLVCFQAVRGRLAKRKQRRILP